MIQNTQVDIAPKRLEINYFFVNCNWLKSGKVPINIIESKHYESGLYNFEGFILFTTCVVMK